MKKIIIIAFFFIFIFSGCLNSYYRWKKPKQLHLPKANTLLTEEDSCIIKNIFFLQHNKNSISNCFLFLLKNQSVYFSYDNFFNNYLTLNSRKEIEKEINRICNKEWKWNYKNIERWGFYRILQDTIIIQYFSYIGPVIPSSTRIAEIRGRILPDSTIEIEKSIFRKPNGELYDVGGHDTTFNPPLRFIKYNTTFIPDFTKSVLYRSVWYQNYLQTKPD